MGSQFLLLPCLSALPEDAPHSARQGAAPFLKMPPSPKQIKVEFEVKEVLHQVPNTTQLQRVFKYTKVQKCVWGRCGNQYSKVEYNHLSLPLTHPQDNCSSNPEATPKCVGQEEEAQDRRGDKAGKSRNLHTSNLNLLLAGGSRTQSVCCDEQPKLKP